MIEVYQLPQGRMIIGQADERVSVGLLQLEPGQALQKHNRPVKEALFQMQGRCLIELFDEEGRVEQVTLNEGDRLEIPAGQDHIHANPFEGPAVTFWKFEGDIVAIIEQIRQNVNTYFK